MTSIHNSSDDQLIVAFAGLCYFFLNLVAEFNKKVLVLNLFLSADAVPHQADYALYGRSYSPIFEARILRL